MADLNDFHGHRGMGKEPPKISDLDYSDDIEVCCLCWTDHPSSDMQWVEGQGLTCNQCVNDKYKPIRLFKTE
jgi:hypothetical protein